MAADLEIKIETTADTAGVEETQQAVEGLSESVKQEGEDVQEASEQGAGGFDQLSKTIAELREMFDALNDSIKASAETSTTSLGKTDEASNETLGTVANLAQIVGTYGGAAQTAGAVAQEAAEATTLKHRELHKIMHAIAHQSPALGGALRVFLNPLVGALIGAIAAIKLLKSGLDNLVVSQQIKGDFHALTGDVKDIAEATDKAYTSETQFKIALDATATSTKKVEDNTKNVITALEQKAALEAQERGLEFAIKREAILKQERTHVIDHAAALKLLAALERDEDEKTTKAAIEKSKIKITAAREELAQIKENFQQLQQNIKQETETAERAKAVAKESFAEKVARDTKNVESAETNLKWQERLYQNAKATVAAIPDVTPGLAASVEARRLALEFARKQLDVDRATLKATLDKYPALERERDIAVARLERDKADAIEAKKKIDELTAALPIEERAQRAEEYSLQRQLELRKKLRGEDVTVRPSQPPAAPAPPTGPLTTSSITQAEFDAVKRAKELVDTLQVPTYEAAARGLHEAGLSSAKSVHVVLDRLVKFGSDLVDYQQRMERDVKTRVDELSRKIDNYTKTSQLP